jgi:hypothetical protein
MPRDGRAQAAILLVALALWAAYPVDSFGGVLLAYAAAWLGVNALLVARPQPLGAALSRGHAWALAALVAAPALGQGARRAERVVETEALAEIEHLTAARIRLERTPSIAPPLVAADRPQAFYVHAPGGAQVAVRFGARGPRVEGASLGEGLFRVEYDPRADGLPDPPDGPVRAAIEVDGDADERSMTAARPLAHPRALTRSPSGRWLAAVSEETDELVLVEAASGEARRVEVDDGPTDARFVDEDTVVVSHRYSADLAWVDVRAARVARRSTVGAFGHRVATHGERLLALARAGSRPQVSILDPRTGEVLARGELGFEPDHLAFGPAGETVVVSSVRPPALHHLRREGARLREDRPPLWLGRPAVTLGASPDGAQLVVAVTDYQPDGPPHLGNHFVQDQLLTVDVPRWAVVDTRLTARRTSQQESPGNVDRGVSPMGLFVQADGSLWVAFAGTDDVWRLDEARDAFPRLYALDEHPLPSPHGVVPLADGGFAVTSPSYGTIGLFAADGALRRLVQLAPTDGELRRTDQRALQRRFGERSFYESTRAGIACQSCHLHGGSDGARHNIGGSALVATLDTRGLMGTPPYLRDGGYPRLGSLHELATTLYRGYRRRQGGRQISLDRFLEDQPRRTPARLLEGRDEARERRGLAVFVRARCPVCHAFPAFTNLGQHPIRSLFPDAVDLVEPEVDTPSLLGLADSAPYLLDGRAETLEEVFRQHDTAGRHGDTRGLSDGELADLVHFLEGL